MLTLYKDNDNSQVRSKAFTYTRSHEPKLYDLPDRLTLTPSAVEHFINAHLLQQPLLLLVSCILHT